MTTEKKTIENTTYEEFYDSVWLYGLEGDPTVEDCDEALAELIVSTWFEIENLDQDAEDDSTPESDEAIERNWKEACNEKVH